MIDPRQQSIPASRRAGGASREHSPQTTFSLSSILLLLLLFLPHPLHAQRLFEQQVDITGADVDRIYVKGLDYLVRTQTDGGFWPETPYGSEPAVVSLAVLAMLAHGEDPNLGPYSNAIQKGLDFVLNQMDERTGYIGRSMYNHGFSALALAEAYGVVNDDRLGPALQKAVDLILDAQKRNPLGAWRYSPDSTDADTTVTGAQIVALYAARNAGLAVPEEAIQKGIKFLLSCQGPDGGVGYTSVGAPNPARTSIACLALALAKQKDSAAFRSAFNFLRNSPEQLNYQQYYLYYGSQAFFHGSPQEWEAWNLKNIRDLSASQNDNGSWDGQFGATFGTSASLLSLALNYRFLPIYER